MGDQIDEIVLFEEYTDLINYFRLGNQDYNNN